MPFSPFMTTHIRDPTHLSMSSSNELILKFQFEIELIRHIVRAYPMVKAARPSLKA